MLCWHVDYWDRLGWTDPFGSKRWSERQDRYAKIKKLKVKGTPQFFIDGEVVPWVKGAWEKIPGQVAKKAMPPAKFDLVGSALAHNDSVRVTFGFGKTDRDYELPAEVVATAYLVKKQAITKVATGENAGKTLTEPFIVLGGSKSVPVSDALLEPYETKCAVPSEAGDDSEEEVEAESPAERLAKQQATVRIAWPEVLPVNDIVVVILIENPKTLEIVDCWSIPVK